MNPTSITRTCKAKYLALIGLLLSSLFLGACNFNTDENATPTVDDIVEEPIVPLPNNTETPTTTPEATNTESASSTPSPSPTSEPQVVIATLSPTPSPLPSETLLPTATPGPWEYTIREGETLGFIIQQQPHNYNYDPAVIDAVVQLNDNILNADILPPPGSVISIPRPTQPPLPPNIPTADANAAATVSANTGGNGSVSAEGVVIVPGAPNVTQPPMRENLGLLPGSYVGCHTVREGETVAGIIEQYFPMTIEIFSRLNADLNFGRCDFSIPGGGPECAPVIRENECRMVVLPSPTPTPSPTPSGQETPTPTPTYEAPRRLSPRDGETRSAGRVTLFWTSVGILEPGEVYLVEVSDVTADENRLFVTENTLLRLPDELVPANGSTHTINWSVSVAVENNGSYIPVGAGASQIHTFFWQSR